MELSPHSGQVGKVMLAEGGTEQSHSCRLEQRICQPMTFLLSKMVVAKKMIRFLKIFC
jgi:hypothetical protein